MIPTIIQAFSMILSILHNHSVSIYKLNSIPTVTINRYDCTKTYMANITKMELTTIIG